MSIFKTTLSVESIDQSTPLKLKSSVNNNLTDDVVLRKITINENYTNIDTTGLGARGGYLYVKSSASNPKHTSIDVFDDNAPTTLVTLYAGEYAILPLSIEQLNIFCKTTHGTAEIEYFFGSRGDEIGESAIVYWNGGTHWNWIILDTATGKPTQFRNLIDLKQYPTLIVSDVVNRKGYVLRYTKNNGNYLFSYINHLGYEIFNVELTPSMPYTLFSGDGRASLLKWKNGSLHYVLHFDGEDTRVHEFFLNKGEIYFPEGDYCTADGTFPIITNETNREEVRQEKLFLIKGRDKKLIKETYPSDFLTYPFTYSHGNFIALETWNNSGIDTLQTLEIFSTDGILLKSVNFSSLNITGRDIQFYGTGKIQFVYTQANASLIFLNYNQLTGKLIGENLKWVNNNNTNNYIIVGNNYTTAGSINYKPESIAIIMYNNEGYESSSFLAQETDGYLEVTYIINNDTEARNYRIPSTEDSYFVNYGFYDLQASIDDFVLLSANNRTSGPLIATRFASGVEPSRFTLIPDLSIYNTSNNSYYELEYFGDYKYLFLNRIGDNQTDTIVYDSKVLDKITTSIDFDWFHFDNSLMVYDYDTGRNYYFSTKSKKWVPISISTDEVWNIRNAGDQHPVKTGKMLLVEYINNEQGQTSTISFIPINQGVIGAEKAVLSAEPGEDLDSYEDIRIQISTETAVIAYKKTQNSNWKVRVFDLNLNFLYEIDTKKREYAFSQNFGKNNFFGFYTNTDYAFYNFNKMLNVKNVSGFPDNSTTVYKFNSIGNIGNKSKE